MNLKAEELLKHQESSEDFGDEDALLEVEGYARATYKGETVNTKPSDAMAKEAIKGLEWRSEYGRGGTEVGVARARDIKNKKELSPSTVRRMYSFFSRHEVDKKAKGFRPGEDGYPSNGRIAWALWGGDPGYSFAKKVVKILDRIDERLINSNLNLNINHYNGIFRPDGPEYANEDDFAAARWKALEQFGLDKPSGDIKQDIRDNKRVLMQRGMNIRAAKPAPDLGPGIIQFIASTDGTKRDGNSISNEGWEFDNFAKNPAFLWCHDYRALPIGRHVDWKVEKDVSGSSVLRVWSQFCDPELYPFADKVRRMYEKGFLRAGSIGWIPLEAEPIENEEGWITGFHFTRNELLEFSAVPIPADPNAIVEAVGRGLLTDSDLNLVKKYQTLPTDSRGIAYTLSNFIKNDESESNVMRAVEEDQASNLKREKESESADSQDTSETRREDMETKEILDAIEGLGQRMDESSKQLSETIRGAITDGFSSLNTTEERTEQSESPDKAPDEVKAEEAVSETPNKQANSVETEASQESETPSAEVQATTDEPTQDARTSTEDSVETRIGASISKSTRDSLGSVAGKLREACDQLDKLLVVEEETSEDSDEGRSIEDVETHEAEETTEEVTEDADPITEGLARLQSRMSAPVKEEVVEEEEEISAEVGDKISDLLSRVAPQETEETVEDEVDEVTDEVTSILKRLQAI